MISTSPSKQAMIKGDTWAIGVPVCSCKISQLTLGSLEEEKKVFFWNKHVWIFFSRHTCAFFN
jgi:hypothetical protein